jgi:hypothetical protein
MKRDLRVITEVESAAMNAALWLVIPKLSDYDKSIHVVLCAIRDLIDHGFKNNDLTPYQIQHCWAQVHLIRMLISQWVSKPVALEAQLIEVLDFVYTTLTTADDAYQAQRR